MGRGGGVGSGVGVGNKFISYFSIKIMQQYSKISCKGDSSEILPYLFHEETRDHLLLFSLFQRVIEKGGFMNDLPQIPIPMK